MRLLLPILAIALIALITGVLIFSGRDPEQLNPGASIPVYRVTSQWMHHRFPRATHPQLYHDGDLVGITLSDPPRVYLVRGHERILAHELGHVADALHGSYWDALQAISTPDFNLYQDRR